VGLPDRVSTSATVGPPAKHRRAGLGFPEEAAQCEVGADHRISASTSRVGAVVGARKLLDEVKDPTAGHGGQGGFKMMRAGFGGCPHAISISGSPLLSRAMTVGDSGSNQASNSRRLVLPRRSHTIAGPASTSVRRRAKSSSFAMMTAPAEIA
jgi:hypothetical protein